MTFPILAFFLGIFVAAVAGSKGRNPLLWGVYGAVFFIVALPHALITQSKRECRHCKATVWGNTTVCEQCRHRISPKNTRPL